MPGTEIRYEYSPESFTLTEPEYAIEICHAVMDVIEPTPERRSSSTCRPPSSATRPTCTATSSSGSAAHPQPRQRGHQPAPAQRPRHRHRRRRVRRCMAGADRVEGTLFGNGERTGNVDIVNLAINLFVNGVDPRAGHQRHRRAAPRGRVLQPPAGAPPAPVGRRPGVHRVQRQPPGRDQEGLRRARRARPPRNGGEYERGACPTCRSTRSTSAARYEAVIRVNSQSGKGGVAYVMKTEHGFDLPRRLQIEFSKTIQHITEDTGTEISPVVMWDAFQAEYLPDEPRVPAQQPRAAQRQRDRTTTSITAQLVVDGAARHRHRRGQRPDRRVRPRAAHRPRRDARRASTTPSTRWARAPRRRPSPTSRPAAPRPACCGASAPTRTSSPRRCAPC